MIVDFVKVPEGVDMLLHWHILRVKDIESCLSPFEMRDSTTFGFKIVTGGWRWFPRIKATGMGGESGGRSGELRNFHGGMTRTPRTGVRGSV